jgi:hypothetical protein
LSISELLESIDEFAFDNSEAWVTEELVEENKDNIESCWNDLQTKATNK